MSTDERERLKQTAYAGGPAAVEAELTRFLAARPIIAAAMSSNALRDEAWFRRQDWDVRDDLEALDVSFRALCRRAQISSVRAFLEAGWHVDWRSMQGTDTALMDTLPFPKERVLPVVRLLLKAGADARAIGVHGKTPLGHCLWLDPDSPAAYVATIKLLLAHGASLDDRDKDGRTMASHVLPQAEPAVLTWWRARFGWPNDPPQPWPQRAYADNEIGRRLKSVHLLLERARTSGATHVIEAVVSNMPEGHSPDRPVWWAIRSEDDQAVRWLLREDPLLPADLRWLRQAAAASSSAHILQVLLAEVPRATSEELAGLRSAAAARDNSKVLVLLDDLAAQGGVGCSTR